MDPPANMQAAQGADATPGLEGQASLVRQRRIARPASAITSPTRSAASWSLAGEKLLGGGTPVVSRATVSGAIAQCSPSLCAAPADPTRSTIRRRPGRRWVGTGRGGTRDTPVLSMPSIRLPAGCTASRSWLEPTCSESDIQVSAWFMILRHRKATPCQGRISYCIIFTLLTLRHAAAGETP